MRQDLTRNVDGPAMEAETIPISNSRREGGGKSGRQRTSTLAEWAERKSVLVRAQEVRTSSVRNAS